MKRRGMTLMETSVAGALLLIFMAVGVRFMAVSIAQRQALDQRQTALQEAANIMEKLSALSWSDLTAEAAAKISLTAETKAILPEGELKIDVTDEAGKPVGKHIIVTIRWRDNSGEWTDPVRLAAWRYQP
jgi:hypothetical protein